MRRPSRLLSSIALGLLLAAPASAEGTKREEGAPGKAGAWGQDGKLMPRQDTQQYGGDQRQDDSSRPAHAKRRNQPGASNNLGERGLNYPYRAKSQSAGRKGDARAGASGSSDPAGAGNGQVDFDSQAETPPEGRSGGNSK